MKTLHDLSLTERLAYSTVRIECTYRNGSSGMGTGFFFNFLRNDAINTTVPVIITNKHVVKDSIMGKLILSKADEHGQPVDEEHLPVEVQNFEQGWKMHPDPDVDLCAMPIASVLIGAENAGIRLAIVPLESSLLFTGIYRENDLDALEEVLMIGYPNGLWDSVNNKPIFRKGITATHPLKNYLGKKEFVIDIACFPGSSGSPIFTYHANTYKDEAGKLLMDSRIRLIGVLYAGPQMKVNGEIEIVDIPTVQTMQAASRVMINLGYVIKAERIIELEKLFVHAN